ncbi:MAG TPA: EamA family transporter [Cyclobacteriaceae bacterium]|nr:EamA family transporter [Cyclobacteriaceae bacterium]
MNNKQHYIAGVIAFVIWGFFSIPLRALQQYPAGQILFFRISFSLAILLAIVFGFKREDLRAELKKLRTFTTPQRNRTIFLTLIGGALLTVNWLVFIYIVNNINVKTASFSYLVCPVITAVLGFILIKERLTTQQWLAVGLCALSCLLIGLNSATELGYSVLTAFTYALYLVSQRRNQGFDRIITLAIQVLFSFLILCSFFNVLVDSVPSSGRFYWVIVLIAALFTVLPLFLNLYALNKISAATVGILMYINPILNFSVAFIVFKETINLLQVCGYMIIVVALFIFNFSNLKRVHVAIKMKP